MHANLWFRPGVRVGRFVARYLECMPTPIRQLCGLMAINQNEQVMQHGDVCDARSNRVNGIARDTLSRHRSPLLGRLYQLSVATLLLTMLFIIPASAQTGGSYDNAAAVIALTSSNGFGPFLPLTTTGTSGPSYDSAATVLLLGYNTTTKRFYVCGTANPCTGGGGGGGGGATIASTSNVIKGDGAGNGVAATPGTDYANASTLRYNVKNYGAVCDGTARQASTVFGSLAALQAAFPIATALTNELDWIGIQTTINAAKNNPSGGKVYGPAGVCILDNSSSVSDGSGTLTTPETITFYPNSTTTVNIQGDGDQITVLRWPSDLGAGKCGILDANRLATTLGNFGRWEGFTLRGPAPIYSTANIGTAQASMSGLCVGSGKDLENISTSGFYAGIDFVGGQNKWIGVRAENNYYGAYWSTPNTSGLVGDSLIERTIFQNNLMAGIGVHHAANINESIFNKVTFDVEPWGIFKETNGGTPTQAQVMNGDTLTSTQFEGMGNGAIGNDRLTTANGASAVIGDLFNTHFKDTYYSWNATYKASAYAAFAPFAARDMNLVEFDGFESPGLLTPGTAGIFIVNNGAANGLTIRGDINTLITNLNSATATARYLIAVDPYFTAQLYNTTGNAWNGFTAQATAALNAGQVANLIASQFGNMSLGSVTAGGVTDTPAGVVMQVGGGNGSSNVSVVVANQGVVSVNASGTYSTSVIGEWIRTGATGTAVQALSGGDPTSPTFAHLWTAPGSTTPTTVTVKLSGSSAGGNSTFPTLSSGLLIPTGTAPTMAPNAAAGTTPTCTATTGHNQAGTLSCTTGTATTTGTLATITFNGTLSTAPSTCQLYPRNAATAPTATATYTTAPSTTSWTIGVATALAASIAYVWGFQCF